MVSLNYDEGGLKGEGGHEVRVRMTVGGGAGYLS